MCGISGYLSLAGERADAEILRRMTATLRHRGPDGEGFHVEGPVALGHRRLRIIDLETGRQPIANETGSVRGVLNGAIYNFGELRARLRGEGHRFATQSDTEVIVHAWEEFGEECVAHLKIRRWTTKYLLKRALAGRLPDAILQRRKQGFGVPIGQWLRGPLRPLLEDILCRDPPRRVGIFSPEAVSRLVQEHVSGKQDHERALWTLLAFELWREAYLPRDSWA